MVDTWFVLAVAALLLEMFSGTFYLLVLAAAFALTGILALLAGTGMAVNLSVCVALSLAGIIWVARKHTQRKLPCVSENTQYDDLDAGQEVVVTESSGSGLLRVQYRGTQWQAKAVDSRQVFHAADRAVIVGREGNIFLIKNQ